MIEIENDKVKLERVGYAHEYSKEELHDTCVYIAKTNPNGCYHMQRVVSNEFREQFAKSIAELIVANWDTLVFDERCDRSESDGCVTFSAYMFIVRKKEEQR